MQVRCERPRPSSTGKLNPLTTIPHSLATSQAGEAIRHEIAETGIEADTLANSNRRRPKLRDLKKYRERNPIELASNELENWRRAATRYGDTKKSYLGFIAIASIKPCMPSVHTA